MKSLYLALGLTVLVVTAGCFSRPGMQQPTNTSGDEAEVYIDDEDMVEVVTEDAYGKDLGQVKRYPDSLRSYYEAYDDEVTVTYQTKASSDDVRDFYTKELQSAGWEMEGEGTDFLEFSKSSDAGLEYLTLYLYDYTKAQGLVEYELYYEPPVTEEEVEDSEE